MGSWAPVSKTIHWQLVLKGCASRSSYTNLGIFRFLFFTIKGSMYMIKQLLSSILIQEFSVFDKSHFTYKLDIIFYKLSHVHLLQCTIFERVGYLFIVYCLFAQM